MLGSKRAAIAMAVGFHVLVVGALVLAEVFDLSRLPVPERQRLVTAIIQHPDAGGGGHSARRAPPAGDTSLPKAAQASSKRRSKPKPANNNKPQEVTQPVEAPSVDLPEDDEDAAEAAAVGSIPEPILTSVVDAPATGIGGGRGGGQGQGTGVGYGNGFGLGMAISDPVPLGDYSHFQIPREDEEPGQIWLAIELDASGKPSTLEVTRSVSPKLDQLAVDIARKFRFIPCRTYAGKDVACAITWIFHVGPRSGGRNG